MQLLLETAEGDRQVAELDKMIEEALDAELKDLGGQAEDKIKDKLFKLGR